MSGAQQPGEGLLARLGIDGWVARGSVEFRGPEQARQPTAGDAPPRADDAGAQSRQPAVSDGPAQAKRQAAAKAPSPSAKAPSPSRGAAPDGRARQEQPAEAQAGQPEQIWFCRADREALGLVVCLGGGDIGEGQARFLEALAVALDSVLPRDEGDEKGGKNGQQRAAGGPRDAILAQRPAANRSQAIPQITAAAEQVRGGAVLWLGPPLDELEDRCRDAGAAVLQGPGLDELMADPQKKRALWEQMRALKRD